MSEGKKTIGIALLLYWNVILLWAVTTYAIGPLALGGNVFFGILLVPPMIIAALLPMTLWLNYCARAESQDGGE